MPPLKMLHLVSPFISLVFQVFTSSLNLDSGTSSKSETRSAVRLPYSKVPNMDYSSRVYSKAIATLAKQVHHDFKPCIKSSDDDTMDVGKCFIFNLSYSFLLNNSFSDKPTAPVLNIDQGVLRRARSTMSDSVILDILDEDSDAEATLRNSLRRQIIESCSTLRVCLIGIDSFIDLFNKSLAKDSTAAST